MQRSMLSLRHFRCFIEVANSGSFTVAAARLFITQSALTATIQQFEEEIGLKLFDRNTRRVFLTPEAVKFRAEAEKIIKGFDAAIVDLQSIAQGQKGHIRITAAPSSIYQFLVTAIAKFREQFPNVTFSLKDANAQQVEQLVADGEFDFAIATKHKDLAELDYEPLLIDRFGIICDHDYPLARGNKPLDWSRLPGADYISFMPDTGIRITLEKQAINCPALTDPRFEISSSTSLLAVLRNGGCYSIVPALTTQIVGFEQLTFRELKSPLIERETYLITRKLRTLSPSSQRLRQVVMDTIRDQTLPKGVKSLVPERD